MNKTPTHMLTCKQQKLSVYVPPQCFEPLPIMLPVLGQEACGSVSPACCFDDDGYASCRLKALSDVRFSHS